MEEENTQAQMAQTPSNEPLKTRVGFPEQKSARKFPTKLIVIIFVLVLLAGGAWFFFFRSQSKPLTEDTSTPTPFKVSEPTPMPTPKEIKRQEIKIQVLNGTGITGGAASIKTRLENLGYSQIDLGNASTQNFTSAEVIFNDDVPDEVQDEIRELLEDTYQEVKVKKNSLDKYDIKITTGYPKGYSPTPTSKPKATASPTSSPKPTGSPTVTPTTTSTPTPTPS